VAILATIFITKTNHMVASGTEPRQAMLNGFHTGFYASVGIFAIAAVWAFFKISDADASRTMQPRPKVVKA
jgi:hypothetical protein